MIKARVRHADVWADDPEFGFSVNNWYGWETQEFPNEIKTEDPTQILAALQNTPDFIVPKGKIVNAFFHDLDDILFIEFWPQELLDAAEQVSEQEIVLEEYPCLPSMIEIEFLKEEIIKDES